MTIHTTPFVIPPLTSNESTAGIATGTVVATSDGGQAVYVQASSEIAQYNAVAVAVDYTVVNATTAALTQATGTGRQIAFAQTSIASGNYGWVQTSGRPKCKLAANCADRVALFATSTAGTLDDAVVSGAQVDGAVFRTSAAGAGTAVAVIDRPAMNGQG